MIIRKPAILSLILSLKLFYHMLKVDHKKGEIGERSFILTKWYILRKMVKYNNK